MRLFSRNPSIYPVSVAIVAGLTVAVVYGMITVWCIVGGSGGWGLHFTSAALQVVGWSFLSLLVAQLVAVLHRKVGPPQPDAQGPDRPNG